MSILCQTATSASRDPVDDPPIMALLHVGPRLHRPFRTAPGDYKHILVAVDKFTE
jgi:hypothetical protein